MVTVYTLRSRKATRKILDWFTEQDIPYHERVVSKTNPLTSQEINEMLAKSLDGLDTILAPAALISIDDLKMSEVISVIIRKPDLLIWPITLDEHKLISGVTKSELRTFIPSDRRQKYMQKAVGVEYQHNGALKYHKDQTDCNSSHIYI